MEQIKGQMSLFTEETPVSYKYIRPVFSTKKNNLYFKFKGRTFVLVKPTQTELVDTPEAEYILKEVIPA